MLKASPAILHKTSSRPKLASELKTSHEAIYHQTSDPTHKSEAWKFPKHNYRNPITQKIYVKKLFLINNISSR